MTRPRGRPRYLRIMDELTDPDVPRIPSKDEYWEDWGIDEDED